MDTRRTIGVGDFRVTDRMRSYVNRVLDTERISYGPMGREFERRFARMHGCHHAVLSNSGTSSLQVALQTLKELHGWRDEDEVIVPAVTFVATVNVVLHNGLTPVLVDVERDHYGIDPALIEQAITSYTRAIVPVHTFGQPCNMAAISAIAGQYGLKVVEDSCECMGVQHHTRPVGAWGDIACFSTYVAHLLTTGVGGIATTSNPDYAAVMRSLVNHGRDGIYISIDDDNEPSQEIISRRFNFERVGHSYRITELEAAIGLAQLDDLGEIIRARQSNAAYLTERLNLYRLFLQLPSTRRHTTNSHMMYPIVIRQGDKASLCQWLEEHGIETRDMLPLTNQPCYHGLWNPDDYPVAKWINECGLYVGIHQNLTRDDLDYMADVIGAYFEHIHGTRRDRLGAIPVP